MQFLELFLHVKCINTKLIAYVRVVKLCSTEILTTSIPHKIVVYLAN